jgi:hypothetical protein
MWRRSGAVTGQTPPPGGPGATPGANYALPLRAERTGNELRIEAQAVLCALASELNVDANGASGPSYAMAVDSQAADLARARATRDDRGAAAYWDRLAELIYRFDAHIQDTMSARCEAQASAYQLGRGLAEAYWALDPGAPCDPRRPDCWTVLLGEQRCDDLIMLAGRLSAYFGPYCLPAIAGTVRIWQSVASDDRWRRGAEDDLYRQLTRWYDLLALSPDPAIFIGPYALAPTRRLFACALRALLPQLITAAISLGLVVALVTFIADGTAGPPLQAVIGVAAAAGLATATVQARFKNGALDLMARLQRDTYTDLVVAAVTEVPAKARRAPAAGSG